MANEKKKRTWKDKEKGSLKSYKEKSKKVHSYVRESASRNPRTETAIEAARRKGTPAEPHGYTKKGAEWGKASTWKKGLKAVFSDPSRKFKTVYRHGGGLEQYD